MAMVGGAGLGVYGLHRYALRASIRGPHEGSTYGTRLFDLFTKIEERSPYRILRTLGLADWASSYAVPDVFSPSERLLFGETNSPTAYLRNLERITRGRITEDMARNGLTFIRDTKDPAYFFLEGNPIEGETGIKVRFGRAGRAASVASRYKAPLNPRAPHFKPGSTLWEKYQAIRHSQHPAGIPKNLQDTWHPLAAKIEGQGLRNFTEIAGRTTFGLTERLQVLLGDFGAGLQGGTYNKLFHTPFVGEGGLVNQLLTKRALPIYLGLGVALPYADYLTHHAVSNTVIDLAHRAVVARATLTDKLPGARKVTDAYADAVPGSQYAPLALPLGGAFAGALYHYKKVLGGDFANLVERKTSARIFARESDEIFLHYFNRSSPIAKGFAAGLALMLPFIPGMLGSRKTTREQQAIYSGEEPVPIRSGRWWELGNTPWEGGRIKEWRPHWSVLWKSQARKKALWGSEEEYWAHHPILHPLRWLSDPYALEERHYEDRPYPVTSPAFSNVPLIGPLLAATIGKLIKPPRRMHTDVDENDYTLYSTRLEPRLGLSESGFEREILHNLVDEGYKVQTQKKVGPYRLDFAFTGDDGQKIALETDGARFHHTARQLKKDEKRQQYLESQGWEVLRLGSTSYFADKNSGARALKEALSARGVSKNGAVALPPPKPGLEFSLRDTINRMGEVFSEAIGLPGFIGKTVKQKALPNHSLGQRVQLQGSRQLDNPSRNYYDLELGAGLFLNPSGEGVLGYSEPYRRFVQRERGIAQVNEIPNTMPSWLPGDDYLIDFRKGDPFSKISNGYARLPGKGYEAIHPEVEGLAPDRYPDINKLEILGDVAPYSSEFHTISGRVAREAADNLELQIRYEKTLERVRQMRESVIRTDTRRFSREITEISGTVTSRTGTSFTLKEYPNETFLLSSVGTSAADLAAASIGRSNAEIARDVRHRKDLLEDYLGKSLAKGQHVRLTIPATDLGNTPKIRAVVTSDGQVVNQYLLDQGLGVYRRDLAGAETQAMFGDLTRTIGRLAENLSFTGDESPLNPLRYIPQPYNSKLWQEREPIEQYRVQEVSGSRMQRWENPIEDFVLPYMRGAVHRVTGKTLVSPIVAERRDLNTLADMLQYLRAEQAIGEGVDPGRYTNQARRTAIGSNLFSSPEAVAGTLPDRDARYFLRLVQETNPAKRKEILSIVPAETARALEAQWAARRAQVEGKAPAGADGRPLTPDELAAWKKSGSKLGPGDYQRTVEIANFFARRGYVLPNQDSPLWGSNVDYQDVRLKIIENEGYDYHDFNVFDDRAALLWRKPYIDGAARELTSGSGYRSEREIRNAVEQILLEAGNSNAYPKITQHPAQHSQSSLTVNVDVDDRDKTLRQMRRQPDLYT